MATIYSDQFYYINVFMPPPSGTPLSVIRTDLIDANDDGLLSSGASDTVDGRTIRYAYAGDVIEVELASGEIVQLTGNSYYVSNTESYFTPTDGSSLKDATFVRTVSYSPTQVTNTRAASLSPTCFTPGALLTAPDGQRIPVEALRVGDKLSVMTDKGTESRAIRWIGKRSYSGREFASNDHLRPIRIMAGALGEGIPERDLVLSRQHRVMTASRIAKRMFGEAEVLLAAHHLTELPGVFADESMTEVTYLHVLFDDHQVITADGCPVESMYAGSEVLKSTAPESVAEILKIFPELANSDAPHKPARQMLAGHKQHKLVSRHTWNRQPLLGQV